MSKLNEKLRSLFTPVAVMILIVAVAVMTPLASLVGAVRVMAGETEAKDPDHHLSITNLPARYLDLEAEIKAPTVASVWEGSSSGSDTASAELWHANRKIYDTNKGHGFTNQTQYNEVGKYEWRFYVNGHSEGETPFDTYVVWVSQDEYAITMPSVVPTVAPKSETNLKLPLPEKITKDGDDITDQVFGTADAKEYEFAVRASIGTRDLSDKVSVKEIDGEQKVVIDLSELNTNVVGSLKVTYELQDAKSKKTLVARVLNDIVIKNITDIKDVTFANNPTAPSVAGLKYREELELTAPTMPNAKYENSSFAVEAWTKITAVKFSEKQPNNWDKVANVDLSSAEAPVAVNGLKVTALKLGWYKFQFTTNTLFGNKTESTDDVDGVYWSDAVHVSQDSTAPEFKWVKAYGEEDGASMSANFKDIDDSDLYDKYLPMTNKPTNTSTTKITVDANRGITFPAILAHDNGTEYGDLRYSVSVVQQTDSNWNTLKNTSNQESVSGGKNVVTNSYHPYQTFSIKFTQTDNPTTKSGNEIDMVNAGGLYQVTFRVTESQPTYSDDSAGTGYDRSASKTYYFWVKTQNYTDTAPTISSFSVSDVYLWEGRTFAFNIPTFTDRDTPSNSIDTLYYLVSDEEDNEIKVELKKSNITNGRMTVDLDEYDDLKSFSGKAKIYAVARNFAALQGDLNNPESTPFEFDPEELGVGVAAKAAEFEIYSSTSASAKLASVKVVAKQGDNNDTTNFVSNQKITLSSIKATWQGGKAADGRISVSVYRLKDGKRTAVKLYNQYNKVVSAVLFNHKDVEIKDWYFTPDSGTTYQVVVAVKENASANTYYAIYEYGVNHNGTWEGAPIGAGFSSVSAMAVSNNKATTTVGTTMTLPDYQARSVDNKIILAKNRLLYEVKDDGAIEEIVGDYYTITVKGVNDPYCVTGNKFTPNLTGSYEFEYTFYYTVNGVQTAYEIFNYAVTVTDTESTSASMQLDEAYANEHSMTMDDYNDGENDADITNDDVKTVLFLKEFMLANRGGAMNFTVDQDLLRKHLQKETVEGDNGQSTTYFRYPAIAIPMPNVLNGAVSSEDIEITVQKSGSSDYLVSSKKANISGPDGSMTDSLLGTVNGYYVFRPDGKFSNDDPDFMSSNTYGQKSETSGVYIVTYTMPDGTTMTYNITIGNPDIGTLEFDMNGFLTYEKNGKTVNIDSNNTNPVIDPNGDKKRLVTIHLDKVTYTGENQDFIDLIEKGPTKNDKDEKDPKKLAQMYMFEHASVNVYKDGAIYIYHWQFKDEEIDENAMTYTFEITESGTYRVEVNLQNPFMNSYNAATKTFEFTIDTTATNNNVNLNTVWFIILMILSVGLLAGVIFYFVKTARETKFLDAPKAPKKNQKDAKDAKKTPEVKDAKVEDKK